MLLGRENSFMMEPLHQIELAKSNNNDDIMTRRLKNRERQRRYRARKRLETDMKKACTVNNTTQLQIVMQANVIPDNYVISIHCQRDWKKDARRAHARKEQEVISNGPAIAGLTSAAEHQVTMFPSGAETTAPVEDDPKNSSVQNNFERSITPARKHWKAEARNKKS